MQFKVRPIVGLVVVLAAWLSLTVGSCVGLAHADGTADHLETEAARYLLGMPHAKYALDGPFQRPETDAQEEERRMMIARAAVEAATKHGSFHPVDATALILATQNGESGHYEYRVHAGLPTHLGTQDGGKARCLGQLRTWPGNTLLTKEQHQQLAGLDYAATLRCAEATLAYYWQHAKRCDVRQRPPGKSYEATWRSARMSVGEVTTLLRAYARGRCLSEDRRDRVVLPKPGEVAKKGPLQMKLETWTRMRIAFTYP